MTRPKQNGREEAGAGRRLLFSKTILCAEQSNRNKQKCRPKKSHLIFCGQWFEDGVQLKTPLPKDFGPPIPTGPIHGRQFTRNLETLMCNFIVMDKSGKRTLAVSRSPNSYTNTSLKGNVTFRHDLLNGKATKAQAGSGFNGRVLATRPFCKT